MTDGHSGGHDVGFFPRPIGDELTPCALVDFEALVGNAQTMLERCRQHGVRLRPNVKTHKCLEIGAIQTDGAKRGISTSTVKEAEFFADGGFDDILLSTIFTADKLPRIRALAARLQTFSLLVDSQHCLDLLESSLPLPGGKPWRVYIKVDCGSHRSGVAWDGSEAQLLARRIGASGGKWAELVGLYVHEGDAYYKRGEEAVKELEDGVLTKLDTLAQKLRAEGVEIKEITVGSTPTCSLPPDRTVSGLTEFHPGNYIFYDVQQTIIGACGEQDIALKVLTRVKGHFPGRNQLLVDAGFTAMSHDGEGGRVDMGGSLCRVEGHPDLRLVKMHQEVGFIEGKEGVAIDYSKYPIGSQLVLLPYHSCATACQHRQYSVVRGGEVVDVWKTCGGW